MNSGSDGGGGGAGASAGGGSSTSTQALQSQQQQQQQQQLEMAASTASTRVASSDVSPSSSSGPAAAPPPPSPPSRRSHFMVRSSRTLFEVDMDKLRASAPEDAPPPSSSSELSAAVRVLRSGQLQMRWPSGWRSLSRSSLCRSLSHLLDDPIRQRPCLKSIAWCAVRAATRGRVR